MCHCNRNVVKSEHGHPSVRVRILFGFCSDFVRILFGFCSDFVRILFGFCSDFVRALFGFWGHPNTNTEQNVKISA
ncbi:MAG: hypothetical protein JWR38_4691 [Mucilaginibacter sp.]|nr:hypothetical protein [Mucilaginibacter sp.]